MSRKFRNLFGERGTIEFGIYSILTGLTKRVFPAKIVDKRKPFSTIRERRKWAKKRIGNSHYVKNGESMMGLRRLFKNPVFLYVLLFLLFFTVLILQGSLFRWYFNNKRMTDILWTLQKDTILTDEKRVNLTEDAEYWQKSTDNELRLLINYILFTFCCLAGGALSTKLPRSRWKWPEFKDPLKPEADLVKEKSNGT